MTRTTRWVAGLAAAGAATCAVLAAGLSTAPAAPLTSGVAAVSEPAPTESAPSPAAQSPAPASAAEPAAETAGAEVEPRRVSIADLGLSAPLDGLGLQPDGTVEVPSDPDRAGWFDLGPVPGDLGSSVLLGHVDSVHGPAVFARLSELRRGAVVAVELSDASIVEFTVRAVQTYANAEFPADRVYRDHGRRELHLVTCGGVYDRDRGGYQSNVVVYARPR